MAATYKRETGILIPLWTLSHKGDQGIGDIRSLRTLLPWVADAGLSFIQLLPINETDRSYSPYSAISSVALDPIYLDLVKLGHKASVPQPTAPQPVDYPQVRASKDKILRSLFADFLEKDPANEAFISFRVDEAEWLKPYSIFRFLMQKEGDSPAWEDWSPEYNTSGKVYTWIDSNLNEAMQQELLYIQWLQWHCQTQWQAINTYAGELGVKLMGDIPVGVSYNSADVFFESENFQLNWSGGAPPETFFKDDAFAIKWGQNWGVPIYNDEYLRATDFKWWKRRVRKHTETFSMFRIDHILGLYRFYSFPWRPDQNEEFLPLSKAETKKLTGGRLPGFKPHPDDSKTNKAKNLARGAELISHLQEAAGDAHIIGEDLGVVPDYVRPNLEKRKVAGFRICHWEVDIDGSLITPDTFPYHSFATYSTHDHPPISALWEQYRADVEYEDLEIKTDAIKNIQILCEIAGVKNIPKKLKTRTEVPAFNPEIKWAMIDYLLSANSQFCAFMITDLLDLPDRFNTPSTVGNHNWTYRLPYLVEAFYKSPSLLQIQSEMQNRTADKSQERSR